MHKHKHMRTHTHTHTHTLTHTHTHTHTHKNTHLLALHAPDRCVWRRYRHTTHTPTHHHTHTPHTHTKTHIFLSCRVLTGVCGAARVSSNSQSCQDSPSPGLQFGFPKRHGMSPFHGLWGWMVQGRD